MDYAVTHVCGVAAFEPADKLQFDAIDAGRLEQPPTVTQQHRDDVQFEFVKLTRSQQRLRRTSTVHQHRPIPRRLPRLNSTRLDIGVELRATRRHVGRIDVVREHVDRHTVVMITLPPTSQLERATPGYHRAGRAGLGVHLPVDPLRHPVIKPVEQPPPTTPQFLTRPIVRPGDVPVHRHGHVQPQWRPTHAQFPSSGQSAAVMPSVWPTGHWTSSIRRPSGSAMNVVFRPSSRSCPGATGSIPWPASTSIVSAIDSTCTTK